jgi:lysozyme
MWYTGRAKRFSVYHNTTANPKTEEEVKAIMGCDLVFNGFFFNPDGSPCCDIKVDGKVLSNDEYSYYGYGFNKDTARPQMVLSADIPLWENYITCIALVGGGAALPFYASYSHVNAARGQTAMGFSKDGLFHLWCSTDASEPISRIALQAAFVKRGVEDALGLDGGRSCGAVTPQWTVKPMNDFNSDRPRHIYWYICVWLEKEESTVDTKLQISGIDVSEWQGVIDWDKVKASGCKYAFIRAGYGQNNIDKQYKRNIAECNRVGIPAGVYWFSYAYTVEMAKKEAAFCLAAIKDYRIELPVVFDFENDTVDKAKAKGVIITKLLATQMLTAFCEDIEKAGYFAMMYSNPNYLSTMLDAALPERFGLWLAAYPKTVDLNKTPRDCMIWQYSSKGSVSGITGNVDMNCMYVDVMQRIRENGCNHLSDAPTPPVVPPVEPVTPAPWYAAAQVYVVSKGISDGTNPEATVTRAEVWQMLYNAKEVK